MKRLSLFLLVEPKKIEWNKKNIPQRRDFLQQFIETTMFDIFIREDGASLEESFFSKITWELKNEGKILTPLFSFPTSFHPVKTPIELEGFFFLFFFFFFFSVCCSSKLLLSSFSFFFFSQRSPQRDRTLAIRYQFLATSIQIKYKITTATKMKELNFSTSRFGEINATPSTPALLPESDTPPIVKAQVLFIAHCSLRKGWQEWRKQKLLRTNININMRMSIGS